MPTYSVDFLDAATATVSEPRSITHAEVGGSAKGYRLNWRRLRGGLSEGVDTLEVDNGAFSFTVVPTRGMGIWRAQRAGLSLGWKSPVPGPVHPQFVPLGEPSGLGWLDGFDELLVRCGLESNGAPEFDDETGRLRYPLHGRIGNKPAHKVTAAIDGINGKIVVTGVVDEIRFHFLKLRMTSTFITQVGQPGVQVVDEIENLSNVPAEFQLLYHVNFGAPLLDAGSRVVLPVKTVVPRNAHAAEGLDNWDSYAAPQPGFAEQVYFLALRGDAEGRTRTLLRNAHGTRGASLVFDVRQLPCMTIWKDTGGLADGYVTGLEPGTNYPNPRSFEGSKGRVVKLQPGAKARLGVTIEAHTTPAEVEAAEQDVQRLQAGQAPQIHREPLPDWCA